MRWAYRLIGILWLLIAGIAQAEPPTRIEAVYRVKLSELEIARITEVFQRTGEHYVLTSTSQALGLLAAFKAETIRLRSEGRITAQGLQPLHFTHERTIDTHRNAHADFDWVHNRLTLQDRNGTRTIDLPAGTQDRLSAQYQFMFFVPQAGTEWHFPMSDGSKVELYDYRAGAALMLDTAVGPLQVRYVASLPEEAPRKTELWLATERSNLPCKITITEPNGETLTQTLIQLSITP